MWACLDVVLQPFPCLGNGLHGALLEVRNSSPQGIGFAYGEKLHEERCGTFVPRTHSFLFLVEPLFRLPRKEEGKQTEPDASWYDVFDDDGVAHLQEVLQVCTCILDGKPQNCFACTIVMRPVRSSKFPVPVLTAGPMGTLATAGVE